MQIFIKVVFSLCTSLLLLYTSWMRRRKEPVKSTSDVRLQYKIKARVTMAANHESLILNHSFPFLIQLVYNNHKLVHKLKTTLMKTCMIMYAL